MKIAVGKWLHTFEKSGHVRWQGKVIAEDGDAYRVQLFSWLTGDRNGSVRMTRDELNAATLYSSKSDWLGASERGFVGITEAAFE